MNRKEYRAARRLIRANGYYALRWMTIDDAATMDHLRLIKNATDPLAERASIIAYCKREGIACNVRHTAQRSAA